MATTTPRRITHVQAQHVHRLAGRAITQRLRRADPAAIIACHLDPARPGTVLLHLDSGGNACAALEALRVAGYHAELVHDCGRAQLRVAPTSCGPSTRSPARPTAPRPPR